MYKEKNESQKKMDSRHGRL